MNYFTIDTEKLNNSIVDYKNNKSKVVEEINNIYGSLKNTDAGWNDDNSISFLETLKSDDFKIDNYIMELDRIYENIENFKEEIVTACSNYSYKKSVVLKYNDNKISLILRKIDNIQDYLSSASSYLNLCDFDSDFSAKSRVRQLKNSIKSIKVLINQVEDEIKSFNKKINNILTSNQSKFSKFSSIDLNISPLKYRWSVVNPTIKKVKLEDNREYMGNKTNINSNFKSNIDLSVNNNYSSNNNTIDSEISSVDKSTINNINVKSETINFDSENEVDINKTDYTKSYQNITTLENENIGLYTNSVNNKENIIDNNVEIQDTSYLNNKYNVSNSDINNIDNDVNFNKVNDIEVNNSTISFNNSQTNYIEEIEKLEKNDANINFNE